MGSPATIALEPRYVGMLVRIFDRVLASPCRVVVFGSRARGTASAASDLDLAVDAQRPLGGELTRLVEALEESHIPYSADVVDLALASAALRERIAAEGVTLWTR